ncbi:hypothetical protein GGTG_13125 [Gaeumannomyces tritici R3-111a-1]|uniref:Uncharacterized protein n=1 Tax=Gaeumannomyces tritici (strain R3-111a-1) TaxID=644352 RepID=J3PHZ4_GAET3|nr:hypothetical protein GGTG_13125 [Gaeumannomyces tritici R3-111a-1]EJT69506.1 hypothetical protein GGTG_13125 [Gaeumannomyces tritici R3-111a-1]
MKSFGVLSLLSLVALSIAAPLEARANTVNHDSLFPKPQTVRGGPDGEAMVRFSPRLRIANGCQPYPAVDDSGNVSGGVKPGGSSASNCGDPGRAQTYARAGVVDGQFAIMYSWYMPKDQPRSDTIGAHRHDWENVVVFPDGARQAITRGAASGHGQYKIASSPPTPPTVEYFTNLPTNHELQWSGDARAVQHAVLDWEVMPQASRDALQSHDFGSANVPFKDGSFESNVRKAIKG